MSSSLPAGRLSRLGKVIARACVKTTPVGWIEISMAGWNSSGSSIGANSSGTSEIEISPLNSVIPSSSMAVSGGTSRVTPSAAFSTMVVVVLVESITVALVASMRGRKIGRSMMLVTSAISVISSWKLA